VIYGANPARSRAYFNTAGTFMEEHHLDFALFTSGDFRRDLEAPGQTAFLAAMDGNSSLDRVFSADGAKIYKLSPSSATTLLPGSWWSSIRDRLTNEK
jgi:hypothetical protein